MMEVRSVTMPFAAEFQLKVLRLAIQDPDLLPRLGGEVIQAAFFESPQLASICAALEAYVTQHRSVPDVPTLETFWLSRNGTTVRDRALYRKIFGALAEPMDNGDFVRTSLLEWAKRQAIQRALEQGLKIARQGGVEEFGTIRTSLDEALQVGVSATGYSYYDSIQDRMRLLIEGRRSQDRVPTLFRSVDRALSGGPDAGDLVMVAAQSKGGKTAFLVNVAIAGVFASRQVVYVTLEVRQQKLAYRFDRSFTGMAFWEIERSPQRARKRITSSQKLGGSLKLLEFGRGQLTVDHLQDLLLKLEAEGSPPGLVVMDYLALMRAKHGRYESRREQLAEIAGDLRSLAGYWDIPIWTAHQTTRAALHKRHPSKADLAECYELAAIVDGLFALARTPEEKDRGLARLYILDQREASGGEIVYLSMDLDRMRVRELPEDDLKNRAWMDEFLGKEPAEEKTDAAVELG